MATDICGLEPGAPALGFWPLCPQKWFCTTFKKHHQKQNKMQFYNNANWLFGNGCTRRFRLNVWNTSTIFFAQPQIGIVRFLLPSCKPPDKMSLAFAVADFVLLCSCERYHVFRWWSTSSKVLPYFKHKKRIVEVHLFCSVLGGALPMRSGRLTVQDAWRHHKDEL